MKVRKNIKVIHFLLIFLFSLGLPFLHAHPFFVGICDINYKSETQVVEISLRFFTSDLEKTMEDWNASHLYLGEKNEVSNADSLLRTYVLQEFFLELDGKKPRLNFLGKEVQQELCWIYLEAKDIPDFNKIRVTNRLLFQSFPAQTNLIHVNQRQEIKNLLLTKNNPSGELTWDKK